MPLLWGKTRCKEAAGWEQRIASKLAIAGGVGAAVGSVLSVVQQQPMARFTAASTASFLMLGGCFSVVQETTRLVRCSDSPANSVLGGAAAGALLYKSHGRPAAPGAVVCAALGGAAHLLADRVEAAGGFQNLLVSLDLLDPLPQPPASQQQQQAAQQQQQQGGGESEPAAAVPWPWWHQYLPLRKMTDAEWEEYKAKQDDTQRQRIEAALAGGLPVMVDRHRQQKQQQQQQEGGGTEGQQPSARGG